MTAARCSIKLFSNEEYKKEELEIFAAESWTKDAETHLITRIHELFSHIRPIAQTLKFDLQVQVADAAATYFILNKKFSRNCSNVKVQKLTERELQIINLIAQGFTNKEIAQQLFISIETVRSHRKHILLKTGSKNTALLIKYYNEHLAGNADELR